jgi:hypothetical protein
VLADEGDAVTDMRPVFTSKPARPGSATSAHDAPPSVER